MTTPEQPARAQRFLQANADAFGELVTFVDFAPEKFTPGFVSVNFADNRAAIIEALKQHPECQDIQFEVLEFSDPKLKFLRDELLVKLAQIKQMPEKKLVLLIVGLENSIGMVGDYPPILVDLNYVRDAYVTAVPHPIVFFLPDKSLSKLGEFAPDFWAWRRAVIRFESVLETTRERLHQIVRRNDYSESLGRWGSTNEYLSPDVKRDTIPRLLMEYESGSLAKDKEIESLKSELIVEYGISLYDDNDFDKAKDFLIQSLDTGKLAKSSYSKFEIKDKLGRIEKQQGDYKRALRWFNESALELESLKNETSNLNKALAKSKAIRWIMRRFPMPLSRLAEAIQVRSDYRSIIMQRGITNRLATSYTEALADFTSLIDTNIKYKRAIAQRGFTYRLIENYAAALKDFNRAIELDPKYKWAITHRGKTYQLMENYASAVEDFSRAIELDPKYQWAIASRGVTYGMMEDYASAAEDFTRAIELDPKYKWAIANRGQANRLMENYGAAVEDFTRAIELDPKYKWAIASRGLTYGMMEDYASAVEDFTRAIELDPEYELAIAQRGVTYRLMENYAAALEDFNRATELDPEYEWVIAQRGITYRLMENYAAALEDFNQAIDLNPEYKWVITHRGLTYRLMENYAAALEDFTRAIELDPEYEWAISNRDETHLLAGHYHEALQGLNTSLQPQSNDDWRFYLRALAHKLTDQFKEMQADLEQAIKLARQKYEADPQDHRIIFNLALYHLLLEDFDTAQFFYDNGLQKTPPIERVKGAVGDLEDILTLLPNHPHAQKFLTQLQTTLPTSPQSHT